MSHARDTDLNECSIEAVHPRRVALYLYGSDFFPMTVAVASDKDYARDTFRRYLFIIRNSLNIELASATHDGGVIVKERKKADHCLGSQAVDNFHFTAVV